MLALPPRWFKLLGIILLSGLPRCYPHESDLRALSRMGATFTPPGRSTCIYFGNGIDPPAVISDSDVERMIPHLKPLHRLYLALEGQPITNDSLRRLGTLQNLIGLAVNDTKVDAAGLRHLRGGKQLQVVVLSQGQITREELEELTSMMPHVQFADGSHGILVSYRDGSRLERQWGE